MGDLEKNIDEVLKEGSGVGAAYQVLNLVSENLRLGESYIGTHFNDVRRGLHSAAAVVKDSHSDLKKIIYDNNTGIATVWKRFNEGRKAAYDRGNTITQFRVSDGHPSKPKVILEFQETVGSYQWRDLRESEEWINLR